MWMKNSYSIFIPIFDQFKLISFIFPKFFPIEKARKRPLYEKYLVFTTPNILPPPNEIAMIVECGGGVCSNDYHKEFSSKFRKLAVSSTTDASTWKKIRALHPGIPIISTECLMRNVMQQKMDFDGYKLCKWMHWLLLWRLLFVIVIVTSKSTSRHSPFVIHFFFL